MNSAFTKKFEKITALLLVISFLLLALVSCSDKKDGGDSAGHKDYASSVTLDRASDATLKQEVTVHAYIDGDTTHFNVPESVMPGGVLKARYLAINTPESTGKIEEWGKAAAQYTKDKLLNATSIIIESENDKWNADSTGDRYLVWVWYKTSDSQEYRNLNIEILQEGLAIASNSANNRYGETCMAAISQAKTEKLHVYSGQKDPNFPYGAAAEITLKELRINTAAYDNAKVAFEGVITKNNSNTVYIEEYDPETDMYYGISVYYGYALNGTGLQILTVGNRVRIVGTCTYYETGGYYQVSGVEYSPMRPDDPSNIKEISKGHEPAYRLIDGTAYADSKVEIALEEEIKTFDYLELALFTSIRMENLTVKDCYTTDKEESSSKGAITLYCETKEGTEVQVRTIVLYDSEGNLVTEDYFKGKTIDVKGIVEYFSGEYQIKLFSLKDVTVH